MEGNQPMKWKESEDAALPLMHYPTFLLDMNAFASHVSHYHAFLLSHIIIKYITFVGMLEREREREKKLLLLS